MPGARDTLLTSYCRPAGDPITTEGASGEAAESWMLWGASSLTNTATAYLYPPGTADAATGTVLAAGQWVAPFAGKMESLYYHSSVVGTGSYTFTLQVNGVDSALSLTQSLASQTGNVDAGTSVSFVKGDLISIKVTRVSHTTSATYPVVSTRIRPP